MKKTLLINFGIILNLIFAFAQNFYSDLELKRISTNFNGSSYNGNSLIVYGEGGIILRTTDWGKSWEQININDSLNIIEIISNGKNYYGISKRKYIIASFDDGKSWQLIDYGDNSGFFRIFAYKDNIYLLLERKIWVFNKELEKIGELSFETDSSYYDGALLGNKLVFPAGKGKLGVINLDNGDKSYILLHTYGICDDCPVPTKLFSNKDNLVYFFLGTSGNLYKFDFKLKDAFFVGKLLKYSNAPLLAYDDLIFQIYSLKLPDIHLDTLFFLIFDNVNNKFTQVNQSLDYKYIVGTNFTSLNLISRDTIIAVGKDKLILMSYDGGKNWELKSHLNEYSLFFLFDKFKSRIISPYCRFLRTDDGGATWLPQRNYSPIFSEYSAFSSDPLLRFFSDTNHGFYLGNNIFEPFDTNFVYTANGGKQVDLKLISELQSFSANLKPIATKCYNKTLIVTYNNYKWFYTKFTLFGQNFQPEKVTSIKDTVLFTIFFFNDTLYAIGKHFRDSIANRFFLYYSIDTANTWIEDFSFQVEPINKSSPFTNLEVFSANMIKDDIFIILNYIDFIDGVDVLGDKLYVINVRNKSVRKLLDLEPNEYLWNVYYLNNRYLFSLNIQTQSNSFFPDLLYTFDINEIPLKLKKYQFERYSPPNFRLTESRLTTPKGLLSDTLFAFVAYDSLFNSNVLFFARFKSPTTNIEEEQGRNFYIAQPKPTPATTTVTIRFYWDSKDFDPTTANVAIYDVYGNRIANRADVQITPINNYSADLVWDCSQFPTGVYFVVINYLGNARTSKVVVVR